MIGSYHVSQATEAWLTSCRSELDTCASHLFLLSSTIYTSTISANISWKFPTFYFFCYFIRRLIFRRPSVALVFMCNKNLFVRISLQSLSILKYLLCFATKAVIPLVYNFIIKYTHKLARTIPISLAIQNDMYDIYFMYPIISEQVSLNTKILC